MIYLTFLLCVFSLSADILLKPPMCAQASVQVQKEIEFHRSNLDLATKLKDDLHKRYLFNKYRAAEMAANILSCTLKELKSLDLNVSNEQELVIFNSLLYSHLGGAEQRYLFPVLPPRYSRKESTKEKND